METKAMLPVVLVTGFLGAGKTTLLKQLVEDGARRGLRCAVLINEWGVADIDGDWMRATGADVVGDLSGGCACCSSSEEMIWTVGQVSMLEAPERPDVLILEASGMADPLVMMDALTVAVLLPTVRVAAVLTVVNGAMASRALGQTHELNDLLARQIGLADCLYVNRVGKPGWAGDKKQTLEKALRTLNGRAQLEFVGRTPPDFSWLWPQVESARREVGGASGPAAHGKVQSHIQLMPRPISRPDLMAALGALGPRVWRAKGFVQLVDEGLALVQYANLGEEWCEISPFDERYKDRVPPCQLVFIGPEVEPHRIQKLFWPGVAVLPL